MPAKENVLQIVSKTSSEDHETKLIRKDVDHLVQNIKDNLNLTYEGVQKVAPSPSHHHLLAAVAGGGESAKLHQQNTDVCSSSSSSSVGCYITTSSSHYTARKQKSYLSSRNSRASPYFIPGKVQSSTGNCSGCGSGEDGQLQPSNRKWSSVAARKRYPSMSANGSKKLDLEDPLEMLHELISEGNLLKEAVRRLQLGLSPKIQRNFYDSDEDCRTPPPPIGVGYN